MDVIGVIDDGSFLFLHAIVIFTKMSKWVIVTKDVPKSIKNNIDMELDF